VTLHRRPKATHTYVRRATHRARGLTVARTLGIRIGVRINMGRKWLALVVALAPAISRATSIRAVE
jgi:hypothetical protein